MLLDSDLITLTWPINRPVSNVTTGNHGFNAALGHSSTGIMLSTTVRGIYECLSRSVLLLIGRKESSHGHSKQEVLANI
jgi:hypothetical protein